MSIEYVIARFNENLDWLADVPRHVDIRVYNKGPFAEHLGLHRWAPHAARIWLPNRGREAGTYLKFLIDRYDCLADITVFLQGDPGAHSDILPTEEHEMQGQPFRDLSRQSATDDRFGRPNHHSLPGAGCLPIGEIYERAMGRAAPESFIFGPGAQFAVTRHCIRSKPRNWWQRLYVMCEAEFPTTYPWAMERLWGAFFMESL